MGRSPDRLRVHDVVVQRLDPVCSAATTIRRFILLSVLAAASWVSLAFLDPTAASSTTTPSPEPSSTTPLVDVGGNQALWFIGIIAGGVALLWFSLLFFDVWSTNRWRKTDQRELLDEMIKGAQKKGGGLSVEEVRQLVSAMDRPPRGASGLTQSLLALTIVTLVGVALVATLVSTGSDSVDQRKTIITSLLSITATISGFYFGARTAQTSNEQATKPPEASPTQGAQGPPGVPGPQGTSSEAASSDAVLPSGDAGSSGTALPSVVLLPDEADDEDAEDDAEISDTEPEEAPDPAEHDGSDVELAEPDELETLKSDAEGREGD